jgi:hypothetical protein
VAVRADFIGPLRDIVARTYLHDAEGNPTGAYADTVVGQIPVEWIAGVPARDLQTEEYDALPADKQAEVAAATALFTMIPP